MSTAEKMKVLVIGAGAREHSLCWKLRRSARVGTVYCAPGNPGIAREATLTPLKVDDLEGLLQFALKQQIDLTVVGPEFPLTLGIVDLFRSHGLRIFGPSKAAARIEGSKSFAKEVMLAAGVPTARCATFTNEREAADYVRQQGAPIVLKADGLAAGKGVHVCMDLDQALGALTNLFGELGSSTVVAEEFLHGVEVSYIVATDGERVVPCASAHDYKRIFDGDLGPNTGGMGSVSPTPRFSLAQEQEVLEQVIAPVLSEMRSRGTPFSGFLYAGLMLQPDGKISVLEFNARMGDPECQSILRRLDSDLAEILYSLSDRGAALPPQRWRPETAVCLVLAADGYPGTVKNGDQISGIAQAEELPEVVVFHAGTRLDDSGHLLTSGGRVLTVSALGMDLAEARSRAYRAADMIGFRGCQVRRDIAKN